MASIERLRQLPEELLQDIVDRFDKATLKSFNLTASWTYEYATARLWREVTLVDQRTTNTEPERNVDDHDDTPIIHKMLLLATRPKLAASVQTLIHRCHLPPPSIFQELPYCTFSGATLSADPRTTALVRLAFKHMERVQTVRIIFGHPHLVDALLRCLFDKNRHRRSPIRRLWLENCRISAGCDLNMTNHIYGLPSELDFSGLESIRFRRLPLRPAMFSTYKRGVNDFTYARSNQIAELHDGAGTIYCTTFHYARQELVLVSPETADESNQLYPDLASLFERSSRLDDRIYQRILEDTGQSLPLEVNIAHIVSHRERAKVASRGPYLDPNSVHRFGDVDSETYVQQRERTPCLHVAFRLLQSARFTLTSICLDWVFTEPQDVRGINGSEPADELDWVDTFKAFFSLRFPSLRAFQYRNAVVSASRLPTDLWLFDPMTDRRKGGPWIPQFTPLAFMEAHPNLQCLAWPMENFFGNKPADSDIASRIRSIIDNLGRTLVDLRVDARYTSGGEALSEDSMPINPYARDRRRRFIEEFAPRMTTVESIKLEGGIPRDEKRETIRALHACPLKKIVMIGVCNPTGNTWGADAVDLDDWLDFEDDIEIDAEDEQATWSIGPTKPESPPPNFTFRPTYGWSQDAPMIHTIASFHAKTVEELKFCGYKGSPVLFSPTPITTPLFAALKHFHNLRTLITSVWLSSVFEEARRDIEIIKYWMDSRSSESKSLVRIMDEEPEGWEKELRTKFEPSALAWYITRLLGPWLSETAKSRKGGVHVRASFSVGDGAIFDIDLAIGKGALNSDVCLRYKGPREELEPDRRRTKLESRRWF